MRIIDFHTYVGTSMFGSSGTPEQLLKSMDENGIDVSVICPVKTTDPFFREQNAYIAKLCAESGGRFVGFARIDPHLGEASMVELEKCFTEYGMKGLLLHPWEETCAINDEKVFPFVELCRKYGKPVMVEAGYPWLSHCFQIADLASRYSDMKFIMTHGGQFDSSGYALTDVDYVMAKYPNLIIENSGNFSDEGIENVPERYGVDRIVFGSHFPWLNTKVEIFRVTRADITDEVREHIFWKNAAELLGL